MVARNELTKQLLVGVEADIDALPNDSDVRADVNFIYSLYELEKTVRFFDQRHWEEESRLDFGSQSSLRLENVAAHTFQVASTVHLLAPQFQGIDVLRAMELALVHDQPEILTGDKDPVGTDGQGLSTHAFDARMRRKKEEDERTALALLLDEMRPAFRGKYQALVEEVIEGTTPESKFLKAIDKLQALVFVRLKKSGNISPDHLAFTVRYSRLGLKYFPPLQRHFLCVLDDLLDDIRVSSGSAYSTYCEAASQWLKNPETSGDSAPIRIALIGKSGAGKSTVAGLLKLFCNTERISTGAICRSIARLLFGDEAKSSTQRIDDALTEIDPSIFLNAALRQTPNDRSVCIDSLRFKSDLEVARARGFTIVRIVAGEQERIERLARRGQAFDPDVDAAHRSEIELDGVDVDHTIVNNGDKEALGRIVHSFFAGRK